jgi:hypothetical protein
MSNIASLSRNKRQISANTEASSNKKQNRGRSGNNDHEDLIWVDTSNKSSWVWKYFKLATNGRTYCFYVETIDNIEQTCNFSCAYNSQTSSMNYHLNSTHKIYERKKMVRVNKYNYRNSYMKIILNY